MHVDLEIAQKVRDEDLQRRDQLTVASTLGVNVA